MLAPRRSRSKKRRLPAYGAVLREIRAHGVVPTAPIVVARRFSFKVAPDRWRIVIPPNEDPRRFDLSIVAGLSVIVVCDSACERNDELLDALVAAGTEGGVALRNGRFWKWIGRRANQNA